MSEKFNNWQTNTKRQSRGTNFSKDSNFVYSPSGAYIIVLTIKVSLGLSAQCSKAYTNH